MGLPELRPQEPLYRQIVAHFQERIRCGDLAPGDAIPPTFELARQFKVANQTAQNALRELSRRGLITRRPRKGSFVSPNLKAATIALVCGRSLLTEPDTRVYAQISWHLGKELAVRGYGSKLYTPSRPEEERTMLDDLSRDIRAGAIRAVAVVNESSQIGGWVKDECQVPWQFTGAYKGKSSSDPGWLRMGLGYLGQRGYRRVGIVVSSFGRGRELPKFRGELAAAQAWLKASPEVELIVPASNFPEQGMAAILARIDRPAPMPEALFVLDDNVCSGVILGLLSRHLHYPRDLGLLAVANKGIPILSPVPLSCIEWDSLGIARQNVLKLLNLLEGGDASLEAIAAADFNPMQLKEGKSCGE